MSRPGWRPGISLNPSDRPGALLRVPSSSFHTFAKGAIIEVVTRRTGCTAQPMVAPQKPWTAVQPLRTLRALVACLLAWLQTANTRDDEGARVASCMPARMTAHEPRTDASGYSNATRTATPPPRCMHISQAQQQGTRALLPSTARSPHKRLAAHGRSHISRTAHSRRSHNSQPRPRLAACQFELGKRAQVHLIRPIGQPQRARCGPEVCEHSVLAHARAAVHL